MIRKFKEFDLDKVMSIWLDSNVKAHSFIPKAYWESNYDFVKSVIPEAEVYVYEEDDNVCGFIGLDDNYIAGLFVEETYRSNGIGKQLLNYVKAIKSELRVKVYKKNERAIAFYKREQFAIETETIDENTNESEYVMRWIINEGS